MLGVSGLLGSSGDGAAAAVEHEGDTFSNSSAFCGEVVRERLKWRGWCC